MRILLTGASGFIGSHVSAALAAEGAEVRAFCRSEPPRRARVAEWCRGDVTDSAALSRAVSGCEAAVHTAGLYSCRRTDAQRMLAVNVSGTHNLIAACVRAGVRRVLLTSSSATCGPVCGRLASELDAPGRWELRVRYKRSKLAAERLALAAAGEIDVVCVTRPPCSARATTDRRRAAR